MVDKSEDKMRLSEFIERRLNPIDHYENKHVKFSRGKAFYEFTNEEDLRFYRDIVYLAEDQANEVRIN